MTAQVIYPRAFNTDQADRRRTQSRRSEDLNLIEFFDPFGFWRAFGFMPPSRKPATVIVMTEN